MSDNTIVTRFAPSPTGFMHVGNVRTAIFAYMLAKNNNGTFILRIEDTDKEREVEGSIEHIIESLKWLGINWDQGPQIGGPHKPYIQSERLDLYKKYAQILIEKGLAYPDPYTTEELEVFRSKSESEKKPFLFRDYRPEKFETWDGKKPLRFKTEVLKSYTWNDEVFGELSFGPEALDDFIIIKSDGYPTYNFAHVIDDIEMGVNFVCRGQEFIPSTPKFLSLYDALGIKPPRFASLPHIMADGGKKKLGKRDGAKDILEYKNEGFIPETMFNFLAFLGWNPGDDREVMSRNEIIKSFDIHKVQKSGAQLNEEKLLWLNKEHLKNISFEEKFNQTRKYLPTYITTNKNYTEEKFRKIFLVLLERISKYTDITKMADEGEILYYFEQPIYDINHIIWKNSNKEKTIDIIGGLINLIEKSNENDFVSVENIKNIVWEYGELIGRGDVLWPLRFSLSGKEKSPDPFTLMYLLGKEEVLNRLNYAKNKFTV